MDSWRDASDPGIGDVLCTARIVARLSPPESRPMSWSELERLVEQAENDATLRRALMHCRSRFELVLAGRRLGFAIDGQDLRLAWQLHQRPGPDSGSQSLESARPQGGLDRCG